MFSKKQIPNIITIARGVFTLIIIVLFLIDAQKYMPIIFILFIIASLSDFVDGYLARKWHVVSEFGKMADPLLDKVLVFSLLILVFEFKVVPQVIILLLILRDLTIDSLRSYTATRGVSMPAITSAKWKTTFQMFMIVFILLFLIYPHMSWLQSAAQITGIIALILSLWSAGIYIKTSVRSPDNTK